MIRKLFKNNAHKHIYYPVAHTGGGEFCRCGKAIFPDGWGIDWKRGK